MRKYLLFLPLVILLCAATGFAQNDLYSTTEILDGGSALVPNLGESFLIKKIKIKNGQRPLITLKDLKTQPANVAHLNFKPEILNSAEPDIIFATEAKQDYAILQIPYYIKGADESVRQIAGFDIQLDYSNFIKQGKTANRPTAVDHSVLANGNWYKISIPSRGIYKIDYAFLQQLGLDPASINPHKIRLYGNGGTALPEDVSSGQPDDLTENAIFVQAAGNTFQQGDYVLFYANGPVLWTKDSLAQQFNHENNPYEDHSYYFLNFDQGNGLRIAATAANGNADATFNIFDDYQAYDRDSINIKSVGRTWWSNPMNSQTGFGSSTNVSMNLGGVTGQVSGRFFVCNTNEASGNHLIMKLNGQELYNFTLNATTTLYYSAGSASLNFTPNTPQLNFTFNYQPNGGGNAYLGYIELNYKRPLTFSGNQLNFRVWESADLSSSQKAGYTISNAGTGLNVWDITNPLRPTKLEGTTTGNQYQFTQKGGRLHEFIAWKGENFPNPSFVEQVPNQDLHGLGAANLLIITNDSLLPSAEAFANFHRNYDGKKVIVARVDQIYNEFSSGGQDVGGIRNFIKMFYDRTVQPGDELKNVLMLGAASFDYKNRVPRNTNMVPTYETVNGGDEINAFSTDDYFVILDDGENIFSSNNLLDAGIGRIPALNNQEAMDFLEKMKTYVGPASFGPWKNVVTFVADDHDDGGTSALNHLGDCEAANSYFLNDDRVYNLYKIYADAYQKVAEAGGARYPDVNLAINNRIFNGTFLMAYSGHGNEERWAHEAILTPTDYDSWSNIDQLPIMFTGTCDFGRFDDPEVRYAGVKMAMNPRGGVAAIITTTQAVFSGGNTQLSTKYMQTQFSEASLGDTHIPLGEALKESKNAIGNGGSFNKTKYVLIGDPAIRIPTPNYEVKTDTLFLEENGVISAKDTLSALGTYVLKGSVVDFNGNLVNDFNGSVYVSIFDKPTTVSTVNEIAGVTPNFKVQNSIIAKTRETVVNGQFTAHFVIPKDINYDLGKGKISYYAQSEVKDASGVDTNIVVGGFSANSEVDDLPPLVQPFIDDDKFRDGGVTGPNPVLFVKLSDDHGINVSGGAPGHDLIAVLDEDIQHPFILNDFYETTEGDFRKGTVKFPLANLTEGDHTVRVRAWDTYNNSGEGVVHFTVKSEDNGVISDLYNYPNPVTDQSHFVFQHNQSGVPMDVSIRLYNSIGAIVWKYQTHLIPSGNRTEILWDGTGNNGQPLAKGVYFYKLSFVTDQGVKATAHSKLVLLK